MFQVIPGDLMIGDHIINLGKVTGAPIRFPAGWWLVPIEKSWKVPNGALRFDLSDVVVVERD